MKTDLFQSCGNCWVFHISWHIERSTVTASSFRIWNGSNLGWHNSRSREQIFYHWNRRPMKGQEMSVYTVKNSPCVNKSIFFPGFGLQCYASFRCSTKWFSYTVSPYIWTFKLQTFKDVAMCSISFSCEWDCSLLSISYCWWSSSSTISHLFSLLQPVTLLACSLNASPCLPAAVLYYCSFWDSIL